MTLVVASGGVKRILLAGMSGTGKPTLIGELAARGYRAIDMDEPEWSTCTPDGDVALFQNTRHSSMAGLSSPTG
jgi:hypothetical protein